VPAFSGVAGTFLKGIEKDQPPDIIGMYLRVIIPLRNIMEGNLIYQTPRQNINKINSKNLHN
jgi:hypothetical protein